MREGARRGGGTDGRALNVYALRGRGGRVHGASRACARAAGGVELSRRLAAVCGVASVGRVLPMRCVAGCSNEGPGVRVRAFGGIYVMLCYFLGVYKGG